MWFILGCIGWIIGLFHGSLACLLVRGQEWGLFGLWCDTLQLVNLSHDQVVVLKDWDQLGEYTLLVFVLFSVHGSLD